MRLTANLQQTKYDVVKESIIKMGYDEGGAEGEGDCDLHWSDLSVTVDRVAALKPYQRINHFPGMLEICRKSTLSNHMRRMAQRISAEYNFYPSSFILPKQLESLLVVLRKNQLKITQGDVSGVQTFILKPSSGAQGRGIYLVQTVAQMQGIDISDTVAQRYIINPLLLNGLKFDLRIYCLVLSVDPLKIYLFDEGLARLATTPYESPTTENLGIDTIHLTNYSINKHSVSFVPNGETSSGDDEVTGSSLGDCGTKRLASSVLSSIAIKRGVSYSKLVDDISSIVCKSVMAIQPSLAHTYHTAVAAGTSRESSLQSSSCPCLAIDHHSPEKCSCICPPSQCFEVLGFDIMLDEGLKPWLLEVNHSPSFSVDARLDQVVKSALVTDTLLALGQNPDAREKFVDAQLAALSSRLYTLTPSSSSRRPESGRKRSPFLAEQNLDNIISSMPSFSCLPSSSRPSSAIKRPTSAALGVRPSPLINLGGSYPKGQSLGGPGLLIGPHYASTTPLPSCGSEPSCGTPPFTSFSATTCIGNWSQIFPSGQNELQLDSPAAKAIRARHIAILQAASDNFNDQRCSCSWCGKRTRRRYMNSGISSLLARSDSTRSSEQSPFPSPRPCAPSDDMRSLSSVAQAVSEPHHSRAHSGLPPRSPSVGGAKGRFESCLGRPSSSSSSRMTSSSNVEGGGVGHQKDDGQRALVKSASAGHSPSSAFLALTERRMAALRSKTSYLLSERPEFEFAAGSTSSAGGSSSQLQRKGGLGSAVRRRA